MFLNNCRCDRESQTSSERVVDWQGESWCGDVWEYLAHLSRRLKWAILMKIYPLYQFFFEIKGSISTKNGTKYQGMMEIQFCSNDRLGHFTKGGGGSEIKEKVPWLHNLTIFSRTLFTWTKVLVLDSFAGVFLLLCITSQVSNVAHGPHFCYFAINFLFKNHVIQYFTNFTCRLCSEFMRNLPNGLRI